MPKVLLTGATGFVGSSVLIKLLESNYTPVAVRRSKSENGSLVGSEVVIENIDSSTEWGDALRGCKTVIHCAARVHVMDEKSLDPLTAFREVNTFGTLNLARAAVKEGVKRFIFISSIKAVGECTRLGRPFKNTDEPNPADPYGISKFEAEEGLKQLAKTTGMEVVIIRPPLVYGPGVKGNFLSMLRLVSTGIPLPFGAIKHNLRSLVSIDNLVDLIVTCISHPNAANRVFLVSDDEDISTAELLRRLTLSFGKSRFMLPIPVFLYKVAGRLLGKSEIVDRLCGNLQVDISDTKSRLDWAPKESLREGFSKTVAHFRRNKTKVS